MRYDAAIIGAGADGLGAAIHLARAGRSVVVVERAAEAGGRLQTWEFRPSFFASPFLDSVPEIPAQLLGQLDISFRQAGPVSEAARLSLHQAQAAAFDAAGSRPRGWLFRAAQPGAKLFDGTQADNPPVEGPPALPRIEPVRGGLGTIAGAFLAAAQAAGAQFRFGLAAIDVLVEKNLLGGSRAAGVLLADGSWIEAAAVISTLDFQQSMFSWRLMPRPLMERAHKFALAGRTARLLLALDRPVGEEVLAFPGDPDTSAAWRQHRLPLYPPLRFDPVSARDPGLAPEGAAVATVTLDYIPCRLADSAWTYHRRVDLASQALARLAPHRPGLLHALKAVEIIVPSDIAEALGVTEGDLDGGEAEPKKRPGPRTMVSRFYLGGSSNQRLGTGAAGLAAALALLAD